jgi:hypothetical protein
VMCDKARTHAPLWPVVLWPGLGGGLPPREDAAALAGIDDCFLTRFGRFLHLGLIHENTVAFSAQRTTGDHNLWPRNHRAACGNSRDLGVSRISHVRFPVRACHQARNRLSCGPSRHGCRLTRRGLAGKSGAFFMRRLAAVRQVSLGFSRRHTECCWNRVRPPRGP